MGVQEEVQVVKDRDAVSELLWSDINKKYRALEIQDILSYPDLLELKSTLESLVDQKKVERIITVDKDDMMKVYYSYIGDKK